MTMPMLIATLTAAITIRHVAPSSWPFSTPPWDSAFLDSLILLAIGLAIIVTALYILRCAVIDTAHSLYPHPYATHVFLLHTLQNLLPNSQGNSCVSLALSPRRLPFLHVDLDYIFASSTRPIRHPHATLFFRLHGHYVEAAHLSPSDHGLPETYSLTVVRSPRLLRWMPADWPYEIGIGARYYLGPKGASDYKRALERKHGPEPVWIVRVGMGKRQWGGIKT